MSHAIRCLDCGDPRAAIYKNTRYCLACRLLRDLEWLDAEPRKCRANGCKTEFLPVTRKDVFCGECAEKMASDHTRGKCGICTKDSVSLYRALRVCVTCVRDTGERPAVIAALRKGQRQRCRDNNSPAALAARAAAEEAEAAEAARIEAIVL